MTEFLDIKGCYAPPTVRWDGGLCCRRLWRPPAYPELAAAAAVAAARSVLYCRSLSAR